MILVVVKLPALFHVSVDVCPASIEEGDAERFVTEGR